MTPPNFALYITCLFGAIMAPAATLKQPLHFQSYNVGETATLPCEDDDDSVIFYWYKQTLGQKPMLVSSFHKYNVNGTFYDEFNNNPRFSFDTENNKNHLKISDLKILDSATYYCVASNSLDFKFCVGATVSVKGSGLNVPAVVQQSISETIQPEGSMTLNCTVHTGTCDGEHRVYWFKHSEESHPGLIYTHGGRNDQCERKPDTQTQTCVYNLPMKILNPSRDETYYCAVVSCGHILFGDKIKLDFEDEVNSSVSVYFMNGALAFTTILVVILTLLMYKMSQRHCQHTDNVRFSETSTPNTASDAEDLHYAAFRDYSGNRSRRQRDNSYTVCVYSSVKQ